MEQPFIRFADFPLINSFSVCVRFSFMAISLFSFRSFQTVNQLILPGDLLPLLLQTFLQSGAI